MSKPKFDPSKPYEAVNKPKFDPSQPYEEVSVAESFGRGAIQGASLSFGDEIAGGLEAAGSVLGVRGLGGAFGDIHLETEDEAKQSMGDAYRGARDMRRKQSELAEKANPKGYLTGDVVGSLATGLAAPGSATLAGSAAYGAGHGLGRSKAELSDPTAASAAQAYVDMFLGGGAGMAGYGAGKVIESGVRGAVSKGGDAIRAARDYTQAAAQGAKRGAREAAEAIPGSSTVAGVGALRGAIREIKDTRAAGNEFTQIAEEARRVIRPIQDMPAGRVTAVGAGKELGDDEAVLAALMADGDNPVKLWFAERAATLQPGQLDAAQYNRLLALGTDARNAARGFDNRAAAAELRPAIEQAQGLFKSARDQRFGELQDQARNTFDMDGASSVLGSLDDALVDAAKLKSVRSVRPDLEDLHAMLNGGVGTKSQGLKEGAWAQVSAEERFNRLQQARQMLDSRITWSKDQGLSQAERILRDLRSDIDKALKTSPEKVEGDALYRASKEIEGKFFAPTEFRDAAGGIDVDESKVARLFGNTDQAARFRSALQDLKEYAKREDLSPQFREQAAALATKLEERMATAATQRDLTGMRMRQGPSSPAIERLQSAAKGNSLVADAVNAPAGFLNSMDEFGKVLQRRLGKPWAQMDETERAAAATWWAWQKKNPNASQQQVELAFKRSFGL